MKALPFRLAEIKVIHQGECTERIKAGSDVILMKNITLQDQTYEKLNEMIIKTDFYPGQKLSESKLIKLLGVSRTPIRESLKQLKKQNLLYTFPQSGTYVTKIDMQEVRDSKLVRASVEKEVMTELCDVLDERSEMRLREILDEQKREFERGNISRYHDLDNAFHQACYEIVDKSQIWEWIKQVSVHLDRFRWLHLSNITFDYNKILEEHEKLLTAVKAKKKDKVKTLVLDHINFMTKEQLEILEQYPEFFLEESM